MKRTDTIINNDLFIKSPGEFYKYFKANGLTAYSIRRFRNIIYRIYRQNGRDFMPWRSTHNPYHILVSEIMLQQTQIERVLNKYPLFITKFPDFRSLARARLRSLYTVWQGMGYNRRALALKEIARTVIKPPYRGMLPSAVAAFAFNQPVVFIETNIRRVFIHFFFREQDKVTDHEIIPLIERALDRNDPRNWYYALMDYGSALRNLKENPNKKSTRYKKQSPFAGSNRQMRGKILHLLSEQHNLTAKGLAGQLNTSCDKIREIINSLCREGFIKKKGRQIRMV
jgi:A/G-specific adenine glycosylase